MAEAEAKETKEPKSKGQSVTLNLDELQQIIIAAVTAASAANAQTVAQAVVEAKKPVADPAKEAAEKQMAESTRINRERQMEAMRLSQESCPHKQGSNPLSSFQGQLSSFVIHILDTGLPVAICTNCLRTVFGDSELPEDRRVFREKSGNAISTSGQRFFRNPEKAMREGR